MSNEVQIKDRYGNLSQLYYSPHTDPTVAVLIEQNVHSGRRFRIFYGDTDRPDYEQVHGHRPDPGKDWGEENDVTGTIGRSMGPIKIPLLINNRRSMGGGAIMTDCIVRILINGREVYRHPNYHSQFDQARVIVSELAPEYSHAVYTDESGEVARFHSGRSAINWLAFMRGERMTK